MDKRSLLVPLSCWYMLYSFFWVIPRRLNFTSRNVGKYVKFGRRGINQKKEYNIHNTAKV